MKRFQRTLLFFSHETTVSQEVQHYQTSAGKKHETAPSLSNTYRRRPLMKRCVETFLFFSHETTVSPEVQPYQISVRNKNETAP